MKPRYRRTASTFFAVLCFCMAPLAALAFDCTPLATLDNNGTSATDLIGVNAVPGEVVCGIDYTGWDFHVYEVTIAGPTFQGFSLVTSDSNLGSNWWPAADLLILNPCDPNACLAQFSTDSGTITEGLCLAAGTYTVVVASPDAGGNNIYSLATISTDPCTPIANDDTSWGAMKSRF